MTNTPHITLNNPFSPYWQYQKLFLSILFASLIGLSWLWQPTRQLWDSLDTHTFALLNQSIALNHNIALTWAIMNMRPVDALVGLFLFSFILRGDWAFNKPQVRYALIGFICLLVWMLLLRIAFVNILDLIGWSRSSPSLSVPNALILTEIFPTWEDKYHLKDGSPISFPGDHASVLFIWAIFISHYVTDSKKITVWSLAILFSLPRLAAGAHWLTDDIIGGLVIAMLAHTTAVRTPLLAYLTQTLENVLKPLFKLLKKIPIINKMSLFDGV